jgi:hypothetical protein
MLFGSEYIHEQQKQNQDAQKQEGEEGQKQTQEEGQENEEGTQHLQEEHSTCTCAYERVLLLGDSMGGSGALLFAHLAPVTAVLALVPQVSLHPKDCQSAARDDLTPQRRDRIMQALLLSVRTAEARGVPLDVHVGQYGPDLAHAALLQQEQNKLGTEAVVRAGAGVELKQSSLVVHVHEDIGDHFLSSSLKACGRLMEIVLFFLRGAAT